MQRRTIHKLPPPLDGHYFFDSRWANDIALTVMPSQLMKLGKPSDIAITVTPLQLMKLGKPYTILGVGSICDELTHGVETVKVLIDVGTKKHRAFVKRTICGPKLDTPYNPIWG